MTTTQLSCRCGEIQLALAGAPFAQFYCHCDDCQVMHGAAYVAEAAYRAAEVTVARGTVTTWTFKRNPRAFCGTCGTRLFIDVLAFKIRGVNGALFPPGQFAAQFHMHCRYAVRPVKDDLPHFEGMPSRFGGSDDVVDW
jgi:hypothetical protein